MPKGYRAITLYPFIFVRNDSDKYDKELINHERIHFEREAYANQSNLDYLKIRGIWWFWGQ